MSMDGSLYTVPLKFQCVNKLLALPPPHARPATEALTAYSPIFVEEVAHSHKSEMKGPFDMVADAVTSAQHFNVSSGCFGHMHVVARDGVHARTGTGTRPSRDPSALS